MADPITFSGSPLDRVSNQRRDPAWVEKQRSDEAARLLPIWRLDPLVKIGPPRALAWATNELLDGLDPGPPAVLLGMDDGVPHFAVDVSAVEDPEEAFGVAGVAKFEDLRAAAGQLAPAETAIAAHARSLMDWHARHTFCAVCGGKTVAELAGAHRRCIECAAEHFPRTDPVAIALVARGDRCLLGRNRGWPGTMFSALAGFVEPGETFEEAVRREVFEEAGIRVGAVRYVKCQPWPFPSSLMIGCIGEATSEAIQVDLAELEDARWFDRSEVLAALEGRSQALLVPPPFAVAHHLIRHWAKRELA